MSFERRHAGAHIDWRPVGLRGGGIRSRTSPADILDHAALFLGHQALNVQGIIGARRDDGRCDRGEDGGEEGVCDEEDGGDPDRLEIAGNRNSRRAYRQQRRSRSRTHGRSCGASRSGSSSRVAQAAQARGWEQQIASARPAAPHRLVAATPSVIRKMESNGTELASGPTVKRAVQTALGKWMHHVP